MWYFYTAVLFYIAYLVSEQIDANNWDNLRKHYKELKEQEEQKEL